MAVQDSISTVTFINMAKNLIVHLQVGTLSNVWLIHWTEVPKQMLAEYCLLNR